MYQTFFKQDIPTKEKIQKPIPKISEKKKKRLKEEWSESALFLEIWGERLHECFICWSNIPEPKPEVFSHKLGKWRYPRLRYNKRNIELVCSMECHKEHDRINSGNDLQILKELF